MIERSLTRNLREKLSQVHSLRRQQCVQLGNWPSATALLHQIQLSVGCLRFKQQLEGHPDQL